MRRPKPSKLAGNVELRAMVEAKLELRWSPAQIAGWLGENFPDDPEMRVSHETIQADLDAVANQLNGRPRQTLHWKSPSEALDEAVAMTA
jgi:IS30 family transposase